MWGWKYPLPFFCKETVSLCQSCVPHTMRTTSTYHHISAVGNRMSCIACFVPQHRKVPDSWMCRPRQNTIIQQFASTFKKDVITSVPLGHGVTFNQMNWSCLIETQLIILYCWNGTSNIDCNLFTRWNGSDCTERWIIPLVVKSLLEIMNILLTNWSLFNWMPCASSIDYHCQ